jgi:hypothetical protein
VGKCQKSRSKNKWDLSGMGQSTQLKFSCEAHQEERERGVDRKSNTPVPGDISECYSGSEIRTYCHFTPARTCGCNTKA